jgi:hypothetical protein
MSLPASQARTLADIEQGLHAREPRLAAMFAIFTRLTHDEMLPHRETIDERAWSLRAWRKRVARAASYGGQLTRRDQLANLAAIAVVPFMVIAAISTVVVLVVQR